MVHKQFARLVFVFALGAFLTTGYFQNTASVSAAPDGLNFNVNDTADLPDIQPGDGKCASKHNTCTLRAGIMEANAHLGTDILALQANTNYVLTRAGSDDNAKKGDLDVTDSIDLIGNNATINANGGVTHDRAFQFVQPNPNQPFLSQLSDLTIDGGSTGADGGGISNQAFLLLKHVSILSSHADGQGGGIANNGILFLQDNTIENNDCSCASAQHPGGGGIVNHGGLVIFSSTLDNNKSHFDGGGIWSDGTNLQLSIIDSTLAYNTADRNGGGIYSDIDTMDIDYSTVAWNFADENADDVGYGGGIYVEPNSQVTLGHTLLAENGNAASFLWSWDDCHGLLGSDGYNLIYTNNLCVVSLVHNLVGFAPNLDTFGAHGGPTKTFALKSNSPAIDAGNPTNCAITVGSSPPYDQRGYTRTVDGNNDNTTVCDIGAYEYNSGVIFNLCLGTPTGLALAFPTDTQKVKEDRVWLGFSADCAVTYRVKIRQDTKKGSLADSVKGLTMPDYLTAQLPRGHKYYWRAWACNDNGCSKSAWRSFSVKP